MTTGYIIYRPTEDVHFARGRGRPNEQSHIDVIRKVAQKTLSAVSKGLTCEDCLKASRYLYTDALFLYPDHSEEFHDDEGIAYRAGFPNPLIRSLALLSTDGQAQKSRLQINRLDMCHTIGVEEIIKLWVDCLNAPAQVCAQLEPINQMVEECISSDEESTKRGMKGLFTRIGKESPTRVKDCLAEIDRAIARLSRSSKMLSFGDSATNRSLGRLKRGIPSGATATSYDPPFFQLYRSSGLEADCDEDFPKLGTRRIGIRRGTEVRIANPAEGALFVPVEYLKTPAEKMLSVISLLRSPLTLTLDEAKATRSSSVGKTWLRRSTKFKDKIVYQA